MSEPALQTRLNVVAGVTSDSRMTFVWGQVVSPISVGARGEWAISAPGVLDVHLLVSFDGHQVHVAPAYPGVAVWVRGQRIGDGWWPVSVPSEIAFGDARISVICEERMPSVPPPGLGSTWRVDAQGVGAQPALVPKTVRLASLEEIELARGLVPQPADGARANPMPDDPARRPLAGRSTLPEGGMAPAPVIRSDPTRHSPSAGAAPSAVVVRPVSTLSSETDGRDQRAVRAPTARPDNPARAPYAAAPTASAPLPIAVPTQPVVAAAVPTQPVVAAAVPTQAAGSATQEEDELPVSTVADGGRLRAHAERLIEALPMPEPAPVAPTRAAHQPPETHATVPSPAAPAPPNRPAGTGPSGPVGTPKARAVAGRAAPAKGFAKAWKETSLVKKVILGLLPLAAAAVLLDPMAGPSPTAQGAKKKKPVAMGSSNPVAGASASAPTPGSASGAIVPAPAPSASPLDASGEMAVGIAPDNAAAAAADTASAGKPAGEAAANPAGSSSGVGDSSMLPKVAIDAAFKGHHAEASELYETLAKERPNDPVYPLAARLAREGAVRKP